MYKDDVELHLQQQAMLDQTHADLQAAYNSVMSLNNATLSLQDHWNGVMREVTLVEGRQSSLEVREEL